MTRIDDLRSWLLAVAPVLRSTVTDAAEVTEDGSPLALVQYQGDGDGATLDANARIENYHVTLVTNNAGTSETERMSGIAVLERALMNKASSLERQNPRWDHLACTFVDAQRGDGRATYNVALHVTGE